MNNDFQTRWRDRFHGYAVHGDDDASIAGWSEGGLHARLRNFQLQWVPPVAEQTWLDVGCGAGTYSRLLASHGMQVIGMDYSLLTLIRARERSKQVALWCAADATRLPVRAQSFDGVLCFGVMQALSAPDGAVRELSAAVKSSGELWIDALNAWCLPNLLKTWWRKLRGRPMHLRYDSPWALKRMLTSHGFTSVALYWVPILPSRWQRFQPWVEMPIVRTLLHVISPLGALFSHAVVVRGVRGVPA